MGKKSKKDKKGNKAEKFDQTKLGKVDAYDGDTAPEEDYSGGQHLTGVHKAVIVNNYLEANERTGTRYMIINFKVGNNKVRERQLVITGDENGNRMFYVKDGKKHSLMGVNRINTILAVTIGDTLQSIINKFKPKKMKIFDWDARKELVKSRLTYPKLNGKELNIAFRTVMRDVPKKDKKGKTIYKENNIVPSGEFVERDEAMKFLNKKNFTSFEVHKNMKKPEWYKGYMKTHGNGEVTDFTKNKAWSTKSSKKKGKKNKNKDDDDGVFDFQKGSDKKKNKKDKKKKKGKK